VKVVALVTFAFIGCASTRQLAEPADPRLRTSGHGDGFVVHTDERWKERVDPLTTVRFQNRWGGWSEGSFGYELFVDPAGAWVERKLPLETFVDGVRIEGMTQDAFHQITLTKPDDGTLELDPTGATLHAAPAVLTHWIADLEIAVWRLDRYNAHVCTYCPPQPDSRSVRTYQGKVYVIDRLGKDELGTWRFHATTGERLAPLHGYELLDAIENGVTRKVGWPWRDVSAVMVSNVSGMRTLGGIVLYSALAAAMTPVAAVAPKAPLVLDPKIDAEPPAATWTPSLGERDDQHAGHLFSTWSRVRAAADPELSIDLTMSRHADLMSTGLIARFQFAELFEIGGGVRDEIVDAPIVTKGIARETMPVGSTRAITGVFQIGLALPLDAAMRWTMPLGFEAGRGGVVDADLRFPFGLRYSAPDHHHWFVGVTPAAPSYLHVRDQPRRWSVVSGAEVGWLF
jgi:hypothetical protein